MWQKTTTTDHDFPDLLYTGYERKYLFTRRLVIIFNFFFARIYCFVIANFAFRQLP